MQKKVHGMIKNMSDLNNDSRKEQNAGVWEVKRWWVSVGKGGQKSLSTEYQMINLNILLSAGSHSHSKQIALDLQTPNHIF